MQFHLNGYEPGDPDIADPARKVAPPVPVADLPAEVDVLIVGCGPAGLTLAAQLAAFPDITTCIVEQKSGRLLRGQADGIACRTMEMFNAFGFADRVLRESCWINEVAFWRPDPERHGEITRSGRIIDTEEGLSEFPHVILNQARVHDFFLDRMRDAPAAIEPHYAHRLLDIVSDEATGPVTVRFERLDPGHEGRIVTVRARYVVGCDGARSAVRRSIGRVLEGEAANHAWGVMDVLPVTDFPDIRLKGVIQSAGQGSIILIPREGGYLVRIYVEMDKLAENERVRDRAIAVEDLIAATRRVLAPYAFEVKEVAWWSIYEIGQRLCDRFDDVPAQAAEDRLPRVFIAGDACHTHSPKAGQGMNVSMQDAFNLGWKLAAVLRGQCDPQLLNTYSAERQSIAKELIDFDREWSSMLASKSATELDPAEVQSYFVRHGRYTAGTATRYRPSLLVGEPTHQPLAEGLPIGARFHSAPVIRLADAKPVQLGHAIEADGRWRLFAFADRADPTAPGSRLRALCDFLAEHEDSPVRRHTPPGADIDSVLDVRAVLQQGHRDLALERLPAFLLPTKARLGLRDYEKVFCPDLGGGRDIFTMRGIDRDRGCVVVVRPDQYIAHVLPLDGHAELAAFFARFMRSGALRQTRHREQREAIQEYATV